MSRTRAEGHLRQPPLSLMAGFELPDPRDPVEVILDQWRLARPDLDPAPMGVFGRITRVYLASQHALDRLLADHGLTLEAFDVLMNLRRSAPEGSKTAGELAASSLLTRAGMSVRLYRLEAAGLISRIYDSEDRRVVNVALTEAGMELIDNVVEAHLAQEAWLMAELDTSEQNALAGLLSRLDHSVIRNVPGTSASST
jgi:DNA-binding MarR family transcriptional regulator